MTIGFKQTRIACYIAYITQAIVVNFLPLLFLTFQKSYDITLDKIALLVTINFSVQLITDAVSAKYVDKIGYRKAMVIAHLLCAAGLFLLGILPNALHDAYLGLVVCVIIYATGGGLIEVVVSPIIEACPSDDKKGAMSLLHSFYCWGVMAVILFSTLFFHFFGIQNWPYLAALFGIVPLLNTILFLKVPIKTLVSAQDGMRFFELFKTPVFWLLVALMICAGASEQAVSQWASAYAEGGLGVNKAMGDLLGPCAFALMMGLARVLHTTLSKKVGLKAFMALSTVLCLISYFVLILDPSPFMGLMACAVCGFSVGIMWPGTFSLATETLKRGGTAMFALLALGGDIGCAAGPTVVGFVSNAFSDVLSRGFLAAAVFPLMMLVGIGLLNKYRRES